MFSYIYTRFQLHAATITPILFLFKRRYVSMHCCAVLTVDSSMRLAPGEERWVSLHLSLPLSSSASPLLFTQYNILPAQPITLCYSMRGRDSRGWTWRNLAVKKEPMSVCGSQEAATHSDTVGSVICWEALLKVSDSTRRRALMVHTGMYTCPHYMYVTHTCNTHMLREVVSEKMLPQLLCKH